MTQPDKFLIIGSKIHPHLDGWCSVEKATAMARLIEKHGCQKCIELGVFGGRSVIAMALAHQILGFEAGPAIVVGVDPWRNSDCLEGNLSKADKEWWNKLDLNSIHTKCMEAIWNLQLEDRICIIRNTSQAANALFRGRKWDLIHIDGTHSEEASVRDVTLWLPRLNASGVLIMDDIDWPTTRRAVSMLDESLTRIEVVGNCAFYLKQS